MAERGHYDLTLTCDECRHSERFQLESLSKARKTARAEGWTIKVSWDYHACPRCKPAYVARKKKRRSC